MLEPTIKASFITQGKGTKVIFLKKLFHIKIDPFAKQFLSQEAPPPISLDGGGEVLGWSHYSPHSK